MLSRIILNELPGSKILLHFKQRSALRSSHSLHTYSLSLVLKNEDLSIIFFVSVDACL